MAHLKNLCKLFWIYLHNFLYECRRYDITTYIVFSEVFSNSLFQKNSIWFFFFIPFFTCNILQNLEILYNKKQVTHNSKQNLQITIKKKKKLDLDKSLEATSIIKYISGFQQYCMLMFIGITNFVKIKILMYEI